MIRDHKTPIGSELVKVWISLPASDWHGYGTESVWAERSNRDEYWLRNVPFYATGLSFDDRVIARASLDGTLEFKEVTARGGHSTYRLYLTEGLTVEDKAFQRYWLPLERLGCAFEQATKRLFAVDVPPETDIYEVYALLEEGEAAGVWDFEEGHCGHPLRNRLSE